MTFKLQTITFIISLIIFLSVIELIRKRKLKVIYCFFWLLTSFILLILTIWKNLVDIISDLVGINYAPSLLLLIGFILGSLIILHLTIIISQQSKLIKDLYKELSILKLDIKLLQNKIINKD
jgi:hypothetical protein